MWLAQQAVDQTSTSTLGSNLIFFVFVALAFGALWLMSSRTRKQQREQSRMRDTLAHGDEVMTASGLFGTVVSVDSEVVVLETSPGVTSRWVKAAILKKVDPTATPQDAVAESDADADDQTDSESAVDEFEVPDDLSSLDEGPDSPRRSGNTKD